MRKRVAVRTRHELVLTVLVMLGREADDGCDKRWRLSHCLQVLFRIRARSYLFNAINLNWSPQLPLTRTLEHIIEDGLNHQWDVADGLRL